MSRSDAVADGRHTRDDGATEASEQRGPSRSRFVNYHLLGPVLRGATVRKVLNASPYRRRSSSDRSAGSE